MNESDELPNIICVKCWQKTQTFHTFYCSVELAQNKFYRTVNFVDVERIFQNDPDGELSPLKPIGNEIEHEVESLCSSYDIGDESNIENDDFNGKLMDYSIGLLLNLLLF